MSGQGNTIYLADDKDGNKMILVASSAMVCKSGNQLVLEWQETYYNFIEVGYLNDKIQENDWADAFSVREFMDYIREHSNMKEVPYTDNMLYHLALEIVADDSNSETIAFSHDSNNNDYWYGHINIDPVLARAILDSY